MATTYAGNNDSGDDYWGLSGSNRYELTFTCPGTGAQDIKELSALLYYGSDFDIRLAVYSSDGSSLLAEGDAAVTVSTATPEWVGHMTADDVTGSGQLTGGTSYLLVLSVESTGYARDYGSGTQTYSASDSDYAASGFPASITPSASSYYNLCLRIGVDAAAGGANAPTGVLMGSLWGPLAGPIGD